MMRCVGLALLFMLVGCAQAQLPTEQRWVAYFAQAEEPKLWRGYDVVMLDLDKHPDVLPIKNGGAKVLAYIAVAEIAPYRNYYSLFAREPGFFIRENAWGSWVVDMRNPKWQAFITDNLIARAKAEGFDGIYLDTFDTALAMQLPGTHPRAVELIHRVRERLPKPYLLMVNRAFEVLPQVASDIDIVLAESILVDRARDADALVDNSIYLPLVKQLHALKQHNVNLRIFTLDYPDLNDKTLIKHVLCTQRANGFSPSVADPRLQSIFEAEEVDSQACSGGG